MTRDQNGAALPADTTMPFRADTGTPHASMPRGPVGASSILAPLIIGSAVFALLAYLFVAVRRVGYPFELEWMEGGALDHVRRILAGEPIYVKPSLAFIPYPYTPLYSYLSALVARALGHVDFLPLRLVSLTASLVMFGGIGLLARRATGRTAAGWCAAGLLAATYGLSDGWFDIARIDSLFMAVLVAGIAAIQVGTPAALAIGGLCLALAFFVKQTALIIAAPVVLWSIVADRRRSLALLAPAGFVLAAGLAYLQTSTDGWFWYYAFDLQRKVGVLIPSRVLTYWTSDLRPMAIALLLGGLGLALTARRGLSRERQCAAVAAAAMVGAAWVSRVRLGNFVNALIPAHAGLALLAAIAAGDLEDRLVASGRMTRRGAGLLIGTACLAQFIVLAPSFRPLSRIPTEADAAAGRRLVRTIAAIPGEVFVPCQGYLAELAGKQGSAHMWEIADVLDTRDDTLAPALLAELRVGLEGARFAAVLPCEAHRARLDAAGLATRYRLSVTLFQPDDPAFLPVAGYRVRPDAIHEPRP